MNINQTEKQIIREQLARDTAEFLTRNKISVVPGFVETIPKQKAANAILDPRAAPDDWRAVKSLPGYLIHKTGCVWSKRISRFIDKDSTKYNLAVKGKQKYFSPSELAEMAWGK